MSWCLLMVNSGVRFVRDEFLCRFKSLLVSLLVPCITGTKLIEKIVNFQVDIIQKIVNFQVDIVKK